MSDAVEQELMKVERKQSSVKNNCREKTIDEKTIEMVDHPKHYQSKHGVEVIDIIEEFGLGFHLGNVIKYVLRAGHKSNELEDLEKAKWYLERVIDLKKTEEGK